MDILNTVFYGNPISTWLIALGIFLPSYFILRILKGMLTKKLSKISKETKTLLDDLFTYLLQQTKNWILLILSLYFAVQVLALPENVSQVINTITGMLVVIQVGFWGNGIIDFWIFKQGIQKEKDAEAATNLNVLGIVLKVVWWVLIVILTLDNIPGVEVNSLIASLGVGGIAVALAVQNTLGDLFASLSIALDKPFKIGDFIETGNASGTVEKIGLKSTRIRSLTDEVIVVSNSNLLDSRISNYEFMKRRRVLFEIGVASETPHAVLKKIPGYLQKIIESQEKTTFDRAVFKEIGDFALIFEVLYHLEEPGIALYKDTQQAINLAIIKKFEEKKISMPYPTQTVLVSGTNLTSRLD